MRPLLAVVTLLALRGPPTPPPGEIAVVLDTSIRAHVTLSASIQRASPWRVIERSPNDHVGFGGGGPHFCLGANLARMEIKLMFREIARRLPDIHLDGEVSYLRSNFIGGIKRMPVAFTPTPSLHTVPLERLGSAAGASGTEGFGGDVERTE